MWALRRYKDVNKNFIKLLYKKKISIFSKFLNIWLGQTKIVRKVQ